MPPRVIDFDAGTAMVVTDLHGAGDVYYHLRDTFLALHEAGKADRLVICGDLIHGSGAEKNDLSLPMLLDVLRLQDELGCDRVAMLLGNHEMPHIYGITLAKGDIEFTPRFEAALVRLDRQPDVPYRRKDVIDFLMKLPFYARTAAGVLLTHAGASWRVTTVEMAERAVNFDHKALLRAAHDKLSQYDVERLRLIYTWRTNLPYDQQARDFLAVTGPEDPRYDDLLNAMALDKSDDFDFMWEVLFSRNKDEDGLAAYEEIVTHFLRAITEISPYEQRVLVSGHLGVKGGYAIIGRQQLRLASYAHAHPKRAGQYLLLDCHTPIFTADELVPYLQPVFKAK